MLKKLAKFIKFCLVGTIWTYTYVYCTGLLIYLIWNFNYLSVGDWQTISSFWEGGGRIKSGKDYLFVTCLLLIIPVWILGWKYFYKKDFVQLLLTPVIWYNKRKIKKYSETSSRLVLKNMGGSKKAQKLDEQIEDRMKLFDKNRSPENTSSQIRESIQEKMNSEK